MSDRGLSDELVAAACKDGDPITKVRMVVFAVLTRELSFFSGLSNPRTWGRPHFSVTGCLRPLSDMANFVPCMSHRIALFEIKVPLICVGL